MASWRDAPVVGQGTAQGPAWKSAPTVENIQQQIGAARAQMQSQPQAPMTLEQRGQDVFGFEPLAERGTLLPVGETQSGDFTLATPQIIKDVMESTLLPGHVAQGGSYTPQDALKFTLDLAAPATAGRAPGTGLAPSGMTRKQMVKRAPTSQGLKAAARSAKSEAVNAGTVFDPEDYLNLMGDVETAVNMNRLNPKLHPGASAAYGELQKAIGQDLDIEDMMTLRRVIGIAERSATPELADDRRVAGIMKDMLDDFADSKATKQFRSLWQRAKKVDTIDEIVEEASGQASGFENGIRIGMRRLLKNKKRLRGWTPAEQAMMAEVRDGTTPAKLMRLLGKLSFGSNSGSNFLGGSLGVGAGAAVGGPLGAMASPAIGAAAQKGAERSAVRGADLLRAMAATGGLAPRQAVNPNVSGLLAKSLGPTVGAQLPAQQSQPRGQTITLPNGVQVRLDPNVL